jgi:hypothetical protein
MNFVRWAAILGVSMFGCTQLHSVRRVGDGEPATWVYIELNCLDSVLKPGFTAARTTTANPSAYGRESRNSDAPHPGQLTPVPPRPQ